MSLKREVEKTSHTEWLIWLLIGSAVFSVYLLISAGIRAPETTMSESTVDLRQQAIEVDRQLDAIYRSNAAATNCNHEADPESCKITRIGLLESASTAVSLGQHATLVPQLLQLGELSLQSLDLVEAEMYLQEALTVARQLQSPQLMADSFRLLGQLNIEKRNLARRSAYAYDALLVVRNRIALGQINNSQQVLHTIIADNLEMRRYGAAAGAWVTMARLHEKQHDHYQANLAKIEAARLLARTGSINESRQLLANLSRTEIDDYGYSSIETEIEELALQYQREQSNIAVARDLRRLYNVYTANGEQEKAWEFRIRANEVMLRNSDLAMFQRMPDVVAVLYKSNKAIDLANHFLQQAAGLYAAEGLQDQLAQTRAMQNLVF